ncbi:MAG: RNA polymerase Rpb4 family protein [Methanomassiliicoccaceae archaeon]|nr:RNA polymerase Rpb4 family protein [Methanomassiliicoccaceae archaeon]
MSDQYMTLAEVKDLLTEEHEKRDLLETQKHAMEHAQAVCALSAEDSKRIVEEVSAIEGVNGYTAVKIADLLPTYPEDVRAIFSKERLAIEPPTIDRIIEVVSKYL